MNRPRFTPLGVLMTLGMLLGAGTVRAQAPAHEDSKPRIELAVDPAPSQHVVTSHEPSYPLPAGHAPCHGHKVCVPVPEIKKTPHVVYSSREKDFCLAKCCFGAKNCHGECHHPQCERVRTKRVLVKKTVIEECPSFKCVVEERCHPGCAPPLPAGAGPMPAALGLSTVPVGVSAEPPAAGVWRMPLPSR